jgi:myosin-1
MLSCGDTLTVDGVDDGVEFESLAASLSTIGFTEQESSDLYALLASLLHLGNMTFKGDEDGGRTTLTSNSIPVDKLSNLLGVEMVALDNAVTVRNVRSGRGSIMSMNLDESQVRKLWEQKIYPSLSRK